MNKLCNRFQRTHGDTSERVDLSDVDVEKISGQLQKLTDKVPDLNVEKISGPLSQLDKATDK